MKGSYDVVRTPFHPFSISVLFSLCPCYSCAGLTIPLQETDPDAKSRTSWPCASHATATAQGRLLVSNSRVCLTYAANKSSLSHPHVDVPSFPKVLKGISVCPRAGWTSDANFLSPPKSSRTISRWRTSSVVASSKTREVNSWKKDHIDLGVMYVPTICIYGTNHHIVMDRSEIYMANWKIWITLICHKARGTVDEISMEDFVVVKHSIHPLPLINRQHGDTVTRVKSRHR